MDDGTIDNTTERVIIILVPISTEAKAVPAATTWWIACSPESRFGDAFTLVAAEESEPLSVVGDMEECGTLFWWWIRHLLPDPACWECHPVPALQWYSHYCPWLPVNEPEAGHGQGEDGWDLDDPVIEEAAPSPQAGNDDEAL